jgi:hypothetical protein
VQIGRTIRVARRSMAWQWRAWRRRCRRDQAALTLFALLSLAVFEPLLCILHCQVWIPFVLQNYFTTQHHHHHMMASAADMDDADMAGMVHISGASTAHVTAQPDGCPFYRGHSSGVPIPVPPSPVHEVTLPLLLLVLMVLLAAMQPATPLTGPPRVFIPVPLRPPIPIAG